MLSFLLCSASLSLADIFSFEEKDDRMNLLVTGGLGFIGSHTSVALLSAGHNVIILDNLQNSSESVAAKIEAVAGIDTDFVEGDVRDQALVYEILVEYKIEAVLHFAGLKVVEESKRCPLAYFDCNVKGSIELCMAMTKAKVNLLIFSSSASIYGSAASSPIKENISTPSPTSPYGRSKIMVENLLADLARSDSDWRIACLRYFNPAGAHESGLIGESPLGRPSNLMPYVARVASGSLKELKVFGGNYETPDGTGIRDYIHVMDLAEGHVAALNHLIKGEGMLTLNLGVGKGVSVLEVIREFESVSGREIPFEIVGRRVGDVAECWADVQLARDTIGWEANLSLSDMCRDAWLWELKQSLLADSR